MSLHVNPNHPSHSSSIGQTQIDGSSNQVKDSRRLKGIRVKVYDPSNADTVKQEKLKKEISKLEAKTTGFIGWFNRHFRKASYHQLQADINELKKYQKNLEEFIESVKSAESQLEKKELSPVLQKTATTESAGNDQILNREEILNLVDNEEVTDTEKEEQNIEKSKDTYHKSEIGSEIKQITTNKTEETSASKPALSDAHKILNEILSTETTFLKLAEEQKDLFEQLLQHLKDPLVKKYVEQLDVALPRFRFFQKELTSIINSDVTDSEKINKLNTLYSSTSALEYYQSLTSLTHLHAEYNDHKKIKGYARESIATSFLKKNKFIYDLLTKINGQDANPIIFVQRLPRHMLLIRDLEKKIPKEDKETTSLRDASTIIEKHLDELNKTKARSEIWKEVSKLLKENRLHLSPINRKSIRDFAVYKIYSQPQAERASKEIQKLYLDQYYNILNDLFDELNRTKADLEMKKALKEKKIADLKEQIRACKDYGNQLFITKTQQKKSSQSSKLMTANSEKFNSWNTIVDKILDNETLSVDEIQILAAQKQSLESSK